MSDEFTVLLSYVKKLMTTSTTKDIKAIQNRVGANQERVVCFNIIDSKDKIRNFFFQSKDGKLKFYPIYKKEPDVILYTNTTTMINIFKKQIKVLDHKTNTIIYQPYTPYDAFRFGHIYGDEGLSITDVKAFLDILENDLNNDLNELSGQTPVEE